MTNMAIWLINVGTTQTFLELQRYLADEEIIQLTEQLERRAFERKHGDVHLKFSNMDGFFSNLFAGATGSARWEVRIYMQNPETFIYRCAWRGEVSNRTLTFSVKNEWCEFDAFSKTRIFWERLKTKRVFRSIPDGQNSGYVTLQYFLTQTEVFLGLEGSTLSDNGTIFLGFDLGEYANRRLRGTSQQPAPIGNEGRFADLDPDTTYADLFEAFQLYYNAEFYIDHDTQKLVMRRRDAVAPGTPRNIDSVLCDDVEPKVIWLDDQKADYIRTYGFFVPATPVFVSMQAVNFPPPQGGLNQLTAGEHRWRVVGLIAGVPQMVSQELIVNLPDPGAGATGWWVTISLPPFPSQITQRWLYRKPPTSGSFHLLNNTFSNSGTVQYEDRQGIQLVGNAPTMPNVRGTFYLFRRYNETTGQWEPDIIDNGSNQPQGNVFEVIIKLGFTEFANPDAPKPYDPYDIYSLFGRETDVQTFANQWIDLFRTKRKVLCKVRDLNYVLNEPVVSAHFPNDLTPVTSYAVKRFTSKLMRDETELELLSV